MNYDMEELAGYLEDAGFQVEDAGAGVQVRQHQGGGSRRGRARAASRGGMMVRPPAPNPLMMGMNPYQAQNPMMMYGQPYGQIPGIRNWPSLIPAIPGVPEQFQGESMTGLDTVTFPASTAAGTELVAFARPNRPFQGNRMILSAVGEDGADEGRVVAVSLITVGDANVPTGGNALPLVGFRETATYVRLSFPVATPGVPIAVRYRLLVATAAANTVTVSGLIVGRTVF